MAATGLAAFDRLTQLTIVLSSQKDLRPFETVLKAIERKVREQIPHLAKLVVVLGRRWEPYSRQYVE